MVSIGKLKQVMEMRKEAKKLQKQLGDELVVGSAMRDQVTVTMDGNQKITHVHIDPSLLSPDNQSRLEGAVGDAVSDAQKKLQQIMAAKLRAGELKIPDLG
jgi:DNA-binding YbaB/EbfC family protein